MDNTLAPKPATDLAAKIEAALTGPAHEKLVVVEWLKSRLEEMSDSLRDELLKEMDGSYSLDAFDTHLVMRVRLPAKWEYISNTEHVIAKMALQTAKQRLAEIEKKMQENGGAVNQNEEAYTIRIMEKKLRSGRNGKNN